LEFEKEAPFAASLDLHLDGSLGTEVGLEHLLEALSSVDVNAEGGSLTHDVSLGVDELERSHSSI
jgi:hypothetical protein